IADCRQPLAAARGAAQALWLRRGTFLEGHRGAPAPDPRDRAARCAFGCDTDGRTHREGQDQSAAARHGRRGTLRRTARPSRINDRAFDPMKSTANPGFHDLATVKTLMTREDFLASLEYQVKFFMDLKQIKTAPDLHKAIVTDLL